MRPHNCGVTELFLAFLVSAAVCAGFGMPHKPEGSKDVEGLYRQRCAACHDGGAPRAPNRAALALMAAENIRFALTSGAMKAQGERLTPAQIEALSQFLSEKGSVSEEPNKCQGVDRTFADPQNQPRWNGWGVDPLQRRFQTAEMGQLSAELVPKLKLKWAFGFPGVNRAVAQPAVFGGRVFVGSVNRKVYSLSAASGCTFWEFATDAPVRTAISVGSLGSRFAVYFGDLGVNAYALDAVTGKLIWKTHVEDHPAAVITGAPTLASDRLYVPVSSYEEVTGADPKYECCKFRGSVSALDAATGAIVWKQYTIAEEPKPVRKNKQGVQLWGPSGAAVWSSPTVDLKFHRVYVTTGDSYSDPPASSSDAFVSFDSDTGKVVWAKQMTPGDAYNINCSGPEAARINCPETNGPDYDFGSSPILVDLPGYRRARSSPGRNPEWFTLLIPTSKERSCGRGASASAAPWVGFSGAPLPIQKKCMWLCPTYDCGSFPVEPLARNHPSLAEPFCWIPKLEAGCSR
jgi:polyvinyl alcohol dehydrogenase (cytochrome)